MKRKLMCLLAMVLFVNFTACNKTKQTGGGGEDYVTLTWLVPGDKQSDIASVLEKVNEITVPAIGAKLDLQFIDTGAFTERMTMNMASGNQFDMCFTGWVNPYLSAVNNGGLMKITDLIEKEAPKLKNELPEYLWDFAKVNGELYAVPNLQVCALPASLVIFKDISKKYNFDFSKAKKMEDLEPYLKMVKSGERNIIPYRGNFGLTMWTYGIYEEITSMVAVRCDGSSPEVLFIDETPEYQQGIKTLKSWFEKGYIRPDVASVGDDTLDYRAGKYAVTQEGWKPGIEADLFSDLGKEVMVVKMAEPYMYRNGGSATMTAIGENSKNPEKAIKFIELINTNKDLYNLISYGIEGKHYTLNSKNKVEYLENGAYSPKASWKFGNQFNSLLLNGQADGIWEETEKLNIEATKSPLMGFVLDTTPIKSEISQISAISSEFSINNYSEEYWDEYINKLNLAGRQKVLKEVQKQVNDFWSKK